MPSDLGQSLTTDMAPFPKQTCYTSPPAGPASPPIALAESLPFVSPIRSIEKSNSRTANTNNGTGLLAAPHSTVHLRTPRIPASLVIHSHHHHHQRPLPSIFFWLPPSPMTRALPSHVAPYGETVGNPPLPSSSVITAYAGWMLDAAPPCCSPCPAPLHTKPLTHQEQRAEHLTST